jgi:putative tricarboxylic transport membrane protein
MTSSFGREERGVDVTSSSDSGRSHDVTSSSDSGRSHDVTPADDQAAGRSLVRLRLVAAGVVLIGLVALVATFQIAQPGGYSPVGPRGFPLIVSVGLLAVGILFLLRVTVWPDRGLVATAQEEDRATHWPTPGLLLLLLIVYAVALQPIGYVLATAVFVPISARMLGSRRLRRDVVAGLVLGVVLYLGFTQFLGVRLPAGLLEPILG